MFKPVLQNSNISIKALSKIISDNIIISHSSKYNYQPNNTYIKLMGIANKDGTKMYNKFKGKASFTQSNAFTDTKVQYKSFSTFNRPNVNVKLDPMHTKDINDFIRRTTKKYFSLIPNTNYKEFIDYKSLTYSSYDNLRHCTALPNDIKFNKTYNVIIRLEAISVKKIKCNKYIGFPIFRVICISN